jgi:hypothetical protein
MAERLERWRFDMKGYIRVPTRFSLGPRMDTRPGTEIHAPPRIPGLSSGTWEYLSIAPNPSLSIYANVSNPLVSANVIFSSSTNTNGGYRDFDQQGGIRDAYLVLKFPDAFGKVGGLAWTVGSLSNRYGNPGPRQTSSGFYGTYLFGRTHGMGETLTANFDLTEDTELVLEHGFSAKLEAIPFIPEGIEQDYFNGKGRIPYGTNFVHHAHGAIISGEWMAGAHYLTSWTPNDNSPWYYQNGIRVEPTDPTSGLRSGQRSPEGRMSVVGADLHGDSERWWGNSYLGYSFFWGYNLHPISDGIQVVHGSNGKGIIEDYFGTKDRLRNFTPTNDSGTIHTVVFQQIFRFRELLLSLPDRLRGIDWAIYAMFNSVRSPRADPTLPLMPGNPDINVALQKDVKYERIKFGSELQVAVSQYMSAGFRYDRLIPNLSTEDGSFSVLSPRAIFRTGWKSKEYVIVDYSYFMYGPKVFPSSPYTDYTQADPHMFVVTAIMSF